MVGTPVSAFPAGIMVEVIGAATGERHLAPVLIVIIDTAHINVHQFIVNMDIPWDVHIDLSLSHDTVAAVEAEEAGAGADKSLLSQPQINRVTQIRTKVSCKIK